MAVNIPIITDFDGKGIDRAVREFKKLETSGEKAAFLLKKSMLPAVAAVGALGVALGDATRAAMQDQAAQAQLATTLRNVTGATNRQIAAVEKQIEALSRASGVADDDLRPAFEALTRGTKDIAESTRQMTLVMDIARGTQRPLVDVADALARAYKGNFRGLQQLSPEMKTLIKDGADMNTVLSVLGGTFGGLSAEFANTAEGGLARLNVAFNEAKESIGTALIPVVEQLIPVLITAAEWVGENSTIVLILAGSVGAFSAAIIVANGVLKAYNALGAITKAVNAGMNTSFTTGTMGIGKFTAVLAIALVTITEFYSMMKDPQAWYEFKRMASNALALVNNIFMAVANQIRNALTVVTNGMIQIANVAIDAINVINPMSDIPKFTEYSYAAWNYGFRSMNNMGFEMSQNYPGFFPNLTAENRGGTSGISPITSAVTLPSVSGGGGGGAGGGGRGGAALPAPMASNVIYAPSPMENFTAESFMAAHQAMFGVNEIEVNINGGMATSAEIGEAVVNALRQYNQVQGPIPVAVA